VYSSYGCADPTERYLRLLAQIEIDRLSAIRGTIVKTWGFGVPKIQRLPGGQLVVTIPKAIARFKGWKKGDEVIFKEDKNTGRVLLINKDEIE